MGRVFERQAKESAKAFAAFSAYLGMGPERSLEAVRRKCGKSSRLVQRWSSRWNWGERVRAYEENLAAVEQQAAETLARERAAQRIRRQEEQLEEEWRNRDEALKLARVAMDRWFANEKRCGSLEGIGRLLDLASKLGRLSSGMPTDSTESKVETGVAVRLELNAALNKVYGDAVEVQAVTLPEGESALPERRATSNPVEGEAPAAASPTTP